MRVLVVEDEVRMARLLQQALKEEGHAVDVAGDGPQGLWLATENQYAAIVLDVMLPGMDGFEICRRLREAGVGAPVLMLTARDGVTDRVRGLDAGADDYLVKPFSLMELAARLRALARRDGRARPPVLATVISGWTRRPRGLGEPEPRFTFHRKSTACWSSSSGIRAGC